MATQNPRPELSAADPQSPYNLHTFDSRQYHSANGTTYYLPIGADTRERSRLNLQHALFNRTLRG